MAGEMGNTITYDNIDANKMLNKAGLLELSGQIKGYIQANAGGGASYTAGDGIDITNDVISSTVKEFSRYYQPPWSIFFAGDPFVGGLTANGVSTKEEALDILAHGGSVYATYDAGVIRFTGEDFDGMGYVWYYTPNANGDFVQGTISSLSASNPITIGYGSNYIFSMGKCLIVCNSGELKTFLLRKLGYDNTISGLTATTIKGAIDELAARPVVSIPADPSADGTYVLQNTVSSGTATYSWGTPSGGGGGTTYTAGTGISIENGVISLNLASAEEEAF